MEMSNIRLTQYFDKFNTISKITQTIGISSSNK